ncbi:hypothetical protein PQY04_002653 [Salmonella enterica]|uniref:Uncharacterized protein n=1 Tax=Salmonella enterica TaxID=28901 RepID=A0A3J0N5W8_SALER|nr:hypothetical protein [Salmonella enterica]ECU4766245.1 hypothetical protein [Salmonella enterica subsp. enterica]EDQ1016851.1 hypothetical protein [Salmonella enterica subsp. houtenae serovar 50:z4,z23:-]EDV3252058.1 hypothetical protein [Salmonella enterica subsp. houtenae]EDW0440662.1 hypothetical protein [Salmonella enterica subsp. arizonae serovar 50:z4,z23:-]HAE7874418.1 hypothetical protein [Salmonella enterica subsp. enterica serovar 1,9,12:-:-]
MALDSPVYLWSSDTPAAEWLFTLVLDYGERGVDPQVPPDFSVQTQWPARAAEPEQHGHEPERP